MNLIVNVDKNWAIGFKGGLLNRIPEDMAFFRKMTTGKVIVMGRKTLESFPGGGWFLNGFSDGVQAVATSFKSPAGPRPPHP